MEIVYLFLSLYPVIKVYLFAWEEHICVASISSSITQISYNKDSNSMNDYTYIMFDEENYNTY